jgi:hypothetical protein
MGFSPIAVDQNDPQSVHRMLWRTESLQVI